MTVTSLNRKFLAQSSSVVTGYRTIRRNKSFVCLKWYNDLCNTIYVRKAVAAFVKDETLIQ